MAARLGKRERAEKRALCANNRRIVQHNMTHGVRDDSRQVIRKHDGTLHVVSSRGVSSDHSSILMGRAVTLGFLTVKGAPLDGEGTRNEYVKGAPASRDKSNRR